MMARTVFEETSTLSSKGQTTVPKAVRQALGIMEGDQIAFRVDRNGVSMRRAAQAADPAIASFLSFLASSIVTDPAQLKTLSPDLAKHIADLTADMKFDPDNAIEGAVDL